MYILQYWEWQYLVKANPPSPQVGEEEAAAAAAAMEERRKEARRGGRPKAPRNKKRR